MLGAKPLPGPGADAQATDGPSSPTSPSVGGGGGGSRGDLGDGGATPPSSRSSGSPVKLAALRLPPPLPYAFVAHSVRSTDCRCEVSLRNSILSVASTAPWPVMGSGVSSNAAALAPYAKDESLAKASAAPGGRAEPWAT
ncbi:hypothetical protein Vretifemale_2459 [Volvox reticuliferus]|nr:hypothetical protein Vretifemale_2459 [Volvox reticuliferus]